MQQLIHIQQGKQTQVGKHDDLPSGFLPKTLNLVRRNQVAREIDHENGKISNAICSAQPTVQPHNDFKAMHEQEKYLKICSKLARKPVSQKFRAR